MDQQESPVGQDTDPNSFDKASQALNLAEKLPEDRLKEIGEECKRGYETDEASRKEWLDEVTEWLKMARQVKEKKTFPWPDASSVKYPLISTAAMQFSARAYPSLVPSDGNIVQTKVWGNDPDGQKGQKGERIGKYMSFQFMDCMDYWEEETDLLFIMVAVCGLMHRKTYYNYEEDRIDSKIVYPENFVVNYWAKSPETAERTSEIILKTRRQLQECIDSGQYLDIELGDPVPPMLRKESRGQNDIDWTTPYTLIEQHTWISKEKSGKRFPAIVTFHRESGKVLRISARFRKNGVRMADDGKTVIGYTPICYYTKYGFIPNPDGSYYDLGFGHLLGPLNEAVNSIVNQLIDAGTLSNMQVGFIGKGLRIKMGSNPFSPGEWKAVNATGDDLRKQIVPLPTKEPSDVLFQLLGTLITSGKELASVAEIFTGKMPGQNTPATTTMATIEQGMKVFTAIYKRIYRSLSKEFKKVFDLNAYYIDKDTYAEVMSGALNPADFDPDVFSVQPVADPTSTTQTEKLLKAQALMELFQVFGPMGLIDPTVVLMRNLQAQEQPDWQELVPGMKQTGQPNPPQQQQDPKVQAIQMKAQADQALAATKMRDLQQKAAISQQQGQQELAMKQQQHQQEMQFKQQELQMKGQEHHAEMQMNIAKANVDMQHHAASAQLDLQNQRQMHQQGMQQSQEMHGEKVRQIKSTSQVKNSTSGKPTQSQNRSSRPQQTRQKPQRKN